MDSLVLERHMDTGYVLVSHLLLVSHCNVVMGIVCD